LSSNTLRQPAALQLPRILKRHTVAIDASSQRRTAAAARAPGRRAAAPAAAV